MNNLYRTYCRAHGTLLMLYGSRHWMGGGFGENEYMCVYG